MPSEDAGIGSRTPADHPVLRFGTIVLVRFPFTSQVASKQRPAVIVSSSAYTLQRPDLIMMAITSQLRPQSSLDSEPWTEIPLRHWQAAGLLKPSVVKPVIATLEQRLVIRQLGVLADEDQDTLRLAINRLLG